MTNASPEMTFLWESHVPSPGQWAAMAGWPVLILGITVLLVNFWRQLVLLRHHDGQNASERLSIIGIATGWFSFIVATGMTWYGLHCTWVRGAEGASDLGFLLLNYAQSSVPGFIGLLIWAGGFFEESLFKALWMRKMKTEHNNGAHGRLASSPP